jgi:hypothetical protein
MAESAAHIAPPRLARVVKVTDSGYGPLLEGTPTRKDDSDHSIGQLVMGSHGPSSGDQSDIYGASLSPRERAH